MSPDAQRKLVSAIQRAIERRFEALENRLDENTTLARSNAETLSVIFNQAAQNAESISTMHASLVEKVQGVRNSLDNEILRQTDRNSEFDQRLTTLESIHGITKEPEIIA